ncbi:MAG TPA: 4Fe-4S dicluster domain-containing protein [Nitrososphaerales archaeon]|nr:4Fe-4S dicluster domain-containing protein [Nitrososphaerales archaeon]
MKMSMVIDLAKCIGCDACSVACKIENSLPEDIWWAPVIQREVGKFPKAGLQFLPLLCMHCEDPPCMKSCPTKAISQRSDGIVLINEDRCAGSRACISACPYNAISLWDKRSDGNPALEDSKFQTPVSLMAEKKHRMGAAQKCTFCSHRVDFAKENGLTPGVDRMATPACVVTCPANCRIFGDVEDLNSPPSKYVREAESDGRTVFVLRPEAKSKPKVAYVW